MIRLLLVAVIVMGVIFSVMANQISDANARIGQLGADNQVLVATDRVNAQTIAKLKRELSLEREISARRVATSAARDKTTIEKLRYVHSKNEDWYGDSLPASVVCLLTNGEGADSGNRNYLCEAKPADRVAEADPRTEIKNKTLTTLTLELQSALDSCNADKADVLTWLDSTDA